MQPTPKPFLIKAVGAGLGAVVAALLCAVVAFLLISTTSIGALGGDTLNKFMQFNVLVGALFGLTGFFWILFLIGYLLLKAPRPWM